VGLTERGIVIALRRHGYRLTPQRRQVVRAIAASHDYFTPATVHEKASRDTVGIGLATVYRTLEVLAELGLICHLHAGGHCPSYTVGAASRDHHHLICSGCGRVEDFATGDLAAVESRLARDSGFRIEGRLLEFTGLCQTCQ
jgi:Fur family ferric uptake transcriptional regulator